MAPETLVEQISQPRPDVCATLRGIGFGKPEVSNRPADSAFRFEESDGLTDADIDGAMVAAQGVLENEARALAEVTERMRRSVAAKHSFREALSCALRALGSTPELSGNKVVFTGAGKSGKRRR